MKLCTLDSSATYYCVAYSNAAVSILKTSLNADPALLLTVAQSLRCSLPQPSETAELVEKLEDAQIALGSMATNRFAVPFRETVTAWLGKLGIVSEEVRGEC